MASSKFKKKEKIQDTEGGGFGHYGEANGGGSPKGGIWGGRSGRVGWDKRISDGEVKEHEHRKDQPRTADGKFTYNSVNGKPLKYESRGQTVNPVLTNGENGIYIKESTWQNDVMDRNGNIIHHKGDKIEKSLNGNNIEDQFKNKSGAYYERFKSNFYQKGSLKATVEDPSKGKRKWNVQIKVSAGDIWEIAKRYDDVKGEFMGEGGNWDENKKGAPGKAGTAAKAAVKKTNEEQYVQNEHGGIKLIGDTGSTLTDMEKRLKKVSGSQLKHSPAEIKAIRDMAAKAGKDFSSFTDEQIDQIMDDYLKKAGA